MKSICWHKSDRPTEGWLLLVNNCLMLLSEAASDFFMWLTLENSKQSIFHRAKLNCKRNLIRMYHRYQGFRYKVEGTENQEKAAKTPSEALNHQTLKNVNSSMKKAEGWDDGLLSSGLKCHGQSVQAAHRAISLTSQSLIFISSEFAQTSKTGLGRRISSRLLSLLEK